MIRQIKKGWRKVGELGVFSAGDFVIYTDIDPPFEMVIKVVECSLGNFSGDIVHKSGNAIRMYSGNSYQGWSRYFTKCELIK